MQDLFSGINRIVELSKKKREAERPVVIVAPVVDDLSPKLVALENELIVLKNNYFSLQHQFTVMSEKLDLLSDELGVSNESPTEF